MLYETLTFNKTISDIKAGLLGSREWKKNQAGKLALASVSGAWDNPWIYFQRPRRKYCHYWWEVHSKRAGLIPQHCRHNCWKAIVSLTVQPSEDFPRGRMGTVAEVFALMKFMQVLNLPSKIGIDIRDYTFGLWRAYFYGETLEEAKQYYDIVKPVLDDEFDPGISLVVQRGCTEMNARLPSRLWGEPVPPADLELERRIDDMIEFEELNYGQSAGDKVQIQENWIKRAIQVGDPTAREVAEQTTRNPEIWLYLVVHADQYHEIDPRGIPLGDGKSTPEEMLRYFDQVMKENGVINAEMMDYMRYLAGEGGDPMEALDEVMESGDPTRIDLFVTEMLAWAETERKQDPGDPPVEPPADPEGSEGKEEGGREE